MVEACDRVLAPHGSLCIELGDTYAGSGGAGGDYNAEGLREGQPKFRQQSPNLAWRLHPDGSVKTGTEVRASEPKNQTQTVPVNGGFGWPLAKSLSLIPELFRLTLVYGTNPLTGRTTDRWRLRNVVRWVRPNPPVGALGDKFRPATSELMVFCKSAKRYFDLDSVREPADPANKRPSLLKRESIPGRTDQVMNPLGPDGQRIISNPAGAPPLDWWNIPLLEGEEETQYGPSEKPKAHARTAKGVESVPRVGKSAERGGNWASLPELHETQGAPPLDWWNIPPGGYEGAHYAVFPPELCIKPIKAMCPAFVCPNCGPVRLEYNDDAFLRAVQPANNKSIGVQGNSGQPSVLFSPMRGDGDAGGETGSYPGERLSPEEPATRLRRSALAGSSNGEQVGGSVRASTDHGGPSRKAIDGRRGSASQERDTQRQPHREPRSDGSIRSLEDTDSTLEVAGLPSLQSDGVGDQSCNECGAALRKGVVLDPFGGSGTTALVATGHGRDCILIDLDERNFDLALQRVGPFILERAR